jgi:hypothetical protein
MTTSKKILGVTTASLLLGSSLALAGSTASHPGANPKAPQEVQNMGCLVGEWTGTATFTMGDQKLDAKASLSCKWIAGGMAISCNDAFTGPMGRIEENDLFGFDAGRRQYHWFAVTSDGEAHDHVAEIPTGDTIQWVYSGRRDDQPMQEIVSFKFAPDSKQIDFHTDVLVNGKIAASLAGHVAKK